MRCAQPARGAGARRAAFFASFPRPLLNRLSSTTRQCIMLASCLTVRTVVMHKKPILQADYDFHEVDASVAR
jgi:hypothetical protein